MHFDSAKVDEFVVTAKNGKKIRFLVTKQGLYIRAYNKENAPKQKSDSKKVQLEDEKLKECKESHLQVAGFTNGEFPRARVDWKLFHDLGAPGYQEFKVLVRSKT